MLVQIRATALALSVCGLYAASAPPASSVVYQLTTIAGSDLVGDGGAAVAAQVDQPEGLVVDSAGNLYIADAANDRVRKVSPTGIIITVAGTGHPGFSGDNGPAGSAQLNQPYGLALDPAGNLYIADYGNQRVRRIGTGGTITTVAGNGQTGSNGDGGPATSAQMLSPRNLAVDPAGNIYVSEFQGHTVRRIATDGTITTFAGTGVAGFSGDGGPAVAAQLAFPAGLALDAAGALYIVDTVNYAIRKVQAGTITTVCNQQNFGVPNTQLSGIAADSAGGLYIPEGVDSVVWLLSPGGTLTLVAGIPGSSTPSGDGGLALQTALIKPVDVAVDTAGDLYISELQRVRSVPAATQIISTVAGDGTFGFSGDGGSALAAVLNGPIGLAVLDGSLYIADQGNQRVREVTAGGLISTVAGGGQASLSNIGDGLPATSATLSAPAGLTFDPAANLYIADSYDNRVRLVQSSGVIITFAGNGSTNGFGGEGDPAVSTPLFHPQGVLADTSGNVYIADSNHDRVIRVDSAGNMNTVAGTGSPGDDASSLPQLQGPTGLALDSAGNLYIADTLNQRVAMLTTAGAISTIAGTGSSGFSGDGGAASSAALSYPCAVVVDSSQDIFIADGGNNRIRVVTPDGNIATIAGTGIAAYSGDSGSALQVALNNPCGLAFDGSGNLLVADTGNNRVRMLSSTQVVVTPPVSVNATFANAASLLPGSLSPGEIFTVFSQGGQGIGPAIALTGAFDASGLLATTLGTTQVLFDNTAAPLFYVQSNQINAQVPYEVAGQTSAQVQVIYNGATVMSVQVSLVAASPALFTVSSGTGQLVAVDEDGSLNSDQNPAQPGSIVVLYATGQGQTQPAGVTGQAAQVPYGTPQLPVLLTIAGVAADVIWAGSAPGLVGLLQINARIPGGFIPAGDLPVILTIGTYQSAAAVTIAVE
jgi:uncharacterized protein (TIGR03437 family)